MLLKSRRQGLEPVGLLSLGLLRRALLLGTCQSQCFSNGSPLRDLLRPSLSLWALKWTGQLGRKKDGVVVVELVQVQQVHFTASNSRLGERVSVGVEDLNANFRLIQYYCPKIKRSGAAAAVVLSNLF
ncbi:hypothetical protein G7046_g843 [Stylonectria norvegica]|nr:hypothetical protein G7046_g843 [Stylonectria norvegica]